MKMQNVTLAGVDVGKTRHDFIVTTPEFTEQKVVRLKGKYVYGKKCIREESAGAGIIITEKRQKDNAFILILAIGEKCCKTGRAVNPNDQVSCPDQSPEGIEKSPYNEEDFFVHEDLLQTVIEK